MLLDEWSEIPIELQPYLADLLRRIILPRRFISLKIAIEHRSRFSIKKPRGEYIGLELGADVAADLNLDDFLVFDNNQIKAVEFFKLLLFKHFKAAPAAPKEIGSPNELIHALFIQQPVFEEFVRAVEGVPRDALSLTVKMITRAFGQKITMQHVRGAARDWYVQDKSQGVNDNPVLSALLSHIVDEVIGRRRARAFLFAANSRNDAIDELFDARITHVLKKNVSTHDEPGVR